MYPNEDLKKTAAGPEDPVDTKKAKEGEPQVIDGPLTFSFAETFKTKL